MQKYSADGLSDDPTLDLSILKDETLNIMLAGRDTVHRSLLQFCDHC